MKQIKTLVVHPDDRSTDFLKPIYAGIPNCKVITGKMLSWQLDLELKAADQIILLGHGNKDGLLAVGQFYNSRMHCVDRHSAQYLYNKKVIGIWCHASSFMKEHGIDNCFSTGMFISEKREADYCGVKDQLEEDIQIQNAYFARLVEVGISLPISDMYYFISKEFGEAALSCPVARYNHERLHVA